MSSIRLLHTETLVLHPRSLYNFQKMFASGNDIPIHKRYFIEREAIFILSHLMERTKFKSELKIKKASHKLCYTAPPDSVYLPVSHSRHYVCFFFKTFLYLILFAMPLSQHRN